MPAYAQRKSTPSAEANENKKPVAVIPFQLVDKHVVIPVLVSGSTDTLHFIFDSGAEVTVLNTTTAAKLHLTSASQAFMSGTNNAMAKTSVTTLNVLYIQEQRLPYVKAYLENLDDLGPVDGIIGIALMKTFIVKIDHRNQQLVLYKAGKTPIGNTGRLLHFQLNFTTPVIDASIQLPNGTRLAGHYHITTGGDYGILFNWPYVDKNRLNTLLPTINTDRVQDMLKVLYYINSSVPSLEVGGHSLKNVPVSYSKDIDDLGVFTEVAGSIGYDVWKDFTLTINYDRKELYLE
ncbi:aspartyl protease family protein [Chitinophaga sp. 22321]|uniref:Aspartyl protease family protein n=1 Tax=Chitinophaga hostae TaxID=2831022 RepID=A0ABS5ISM1_9BACT|nr:aspartyl protease family protein [Chitinophaga hostae]MBS0025906.1 aspartyl protease family protein [Chitinophaga hostae]